MNYQLLMLEYEDYLHGLGYKESTIKSHMFALKRFYEITEKQVNEVEEQDMRFYVKALSTEPDQYKRQRKESTVMVMANMVRLFFKYLYRHENILTNPFERLKFKLKNDDSMREIFSADQMNRFLDCIKDDRDRSIFELMYSSALRISEVVKLNVEDVDLKERMIILRKAKGDKDKYVPYSDVAEYYLKKYIKGLRIKILRKIKKGEDRNKALFIGYRGRLTSSYIWKEFRRYLKENDLDKRKLVVHSIRHSTATHLLEAGADVRYVQELLGHEDIQTTVKYTHLKIESLKRIYKMYHPRENKYYEEVTEEYLKEINKLKEDSIKYGNRLKKVKENRKKNC